MLPPKEILSTWKKFDNFPMETLTKLWYFEQEQEPKQRSVSLMKEHREQFGVSGNCFDLAIWLMDKFKREGIQTYPVGHDLYTDRAHVAVIAVDEMGKRYFCDLGDQWIQPILVDRFDEDFTHEPLGGFFPAAKVQVLPSGGEVEIRYHRPNGKYSSQAFSLEPIDYSEFVKMAELSQRTIRKRPLVECRIPHEAEVVHWEFNDWKSFLSSSKGLFDEPPLKSVKSWATRIHEQTGMDQEFVVGVLRKYQALMGVR
ncbi:hypothetical protein [Alkalibacillus aidingensis]|uniref:hypothetical protein n=1 Tax=Alkalibacillus aidingensis TaxID=2747607 RepID=UPI002948C1A6|nr:hypothetical protein [Alkalibacillus aidingensis]